MGRLSRYESHVKPHLNKIRKWVSEDIPVSTITKNLHISHTAFDKYKREHPELREALRHGEDDLVEELRSVLKQKAVGFHYQEKTTRIRHFANGDEAEDTTIFEKYAQPDLGSIHLLLKNHDKTWHNDDTITLERKQKELEQNEKRLEIQEWK